MDELLQHISYLQARPDQATDYITWFHGAQRHLETGEREPHGSSGRSSQRQRCTAPEPRRLGRGYAAVPASCCHKHPRIAFDSLHSFNAPVTLLLPLAASVFLQHCHWTTINNNDNNYDNNKSQPCDAKTTQPTTKTIITTAIDAKRNDGIAATPQARGRWWTSSSMSSLTCAPFAPTLWR